MSEEGRIEIKSGVFLLCPVDPRLEMFGSDPVAVHSLVRVEIDRVEIQTLHAGNKGKGFVDVASEFFRCACPSGIVAGGENSAGSASGIRFESPDVIALPAVERDRNGGEFFQCRVGIDADGGIILFGGPVIVFRTFCGHHTAPFFGVLERVRFLFTG